jgi:hypothetical protein
MPGSRYTVRSNPSGGRYHIWDNEKNAVAVSADGAAHDNLPLEQAFAVVDGLHEQSTPPDDKTSDS